MSVLKYRLRDSVISSHVETNANITGSALSLEDELAFATSRASFDLRCNVMKVGMKRGPWTGEVSTGKVSWKESRYNGELCRFSVFEKPVPKY